jgi:hypothetical protein
MHLFALDGYHYDQQINECANDVKPVKTGDNVHEGARGISNKKYPFCNQFFPSIKLSDQERQAKHERERDHEPGGWLVVFLC